MALDMDVDQDTVTQKCTKENIMGQDITKRGREKNGVHLVGMNV